MYDKAYKKATSLADLITQKALERKVDVPDPDISTGLMTSTRRAFDSYARTLAGSGGSDIMETTKQAPEDMNADYIASIRAGTEEFFKRYDKGDRPKSVGSPLDTETDRQGAEDYVARVEEEAAMVDDSNYQRGENSLAISPAKVESIIRREAKLRNIDPDVAVRLWQHEGGSSYQSNIDRDPKKGGSIGGKEASFGPFQLFIGGGLGNDYEKRTGRSLLNDNNLEGITTQIQFSLDMATRQGWTPWYGRKPAGISAREGLKNAKPIGNWKK